MILTTRVKCPLSIDGFRYCTKERVETWRFEGKWSSIKGKSSLGWTGREETMDAVDTRRIILMAVFTIEEPQGWKQRTVWSGAKSTLLWLVWIISDAKVTVNGDFRRWRNDRASGSRFPVLIIRFIERLFSFSFPFSSLSHDDSKMGKYGGLRHPCPNNCFYHGRYGYKYIVKRWFFSFYSRRDDSQVCKNTKFVWNESLRREIIMDKKKRKELSFILLFSARMQRNVL